ncbi:hypothetical protein [Pseudobacteroides cellulosolvens]|uniref:Uncharacterized protein n=1 Tax=Pseudobacteroides cellulosolvens ATCC 35603 = DSM 2933 TaxID=398512 RepID=A0A0L6JIY8_9FIRM|nr:hypothetical protein [Pseudobacteroides cellulosolvens]KNY25826.1 hypothetical protein Bccel_1086 [Pseudobacteroides cellulosolvens ATCC 35603 = DSM 2933]
MIILVIILYITLAIYEFVPLYKQKQWKDFWVNAALWTFSFTIGSLIALNVDIPSPAPPIREAITSLFGR